MIGTRFFLLAGVLGTLFPPAALKGQGALLNARLEAVLPPGSAPIQVHLSLTLLPDDSATVLPLTLLTPEGTRVEGLRAGDTPVPLSEIRPHYWTADVPLGAETTLELFYSVFGAMGEKGRLTLPVPAPAWVPEDPGPDTFLAALSVPQGTGITETFPTSVLRRPEGLEGGELHLSLQSVPSMLLLRTVNGEVPLLTVPRILDMMVLALLLGMGLLGLQYLRRDQG